MAPGYMAQWQRRRRRRRRQTAEEGRWTAIDAMKPEHNGAPAFKCVVSYWAKRGMQKKAYKRGGGGVGG